MCCNWGNSSNKCIRGLLLIQSVLLSVEDIINDNMYRTYIQQETSTTVRVPKIKFLNVFCPKWYRQRCWHEESCCALVLNIIWHFTMMYYSHFILLSQASIVSKPLWNCTPTFSFTGVIDVSVAISITVTEDFKSVFGWYKNSSTAVAITVTTPTSWHLSAALLSHKYMLFLCGRLSGGCRCVRLRCTPAEMIYIPPSRFRYIYGKCHKLLL